MLNHSRSNNLCEIRLSVPDETLSALKLTPDEVGAELRLAAAQLQQESRLA